MKDINYMPQHSKNFISQVSGNIRSLKPGHIVKFKYKSKYDPDYKAHQYPTVLILNTNYQGKLHGLALRFLSVIQLKQLKNTISTTLIQKAKKVITPSKYKRLDVIDNPYIFYHNKLKGFLKSLNDNIYRTYFLSNIHSVKIINYKFREEIRENFDINKNKPQDTSKVLND